MVAVVDVMVLIVWAVVEIVLVCVVQLRRWRLGQ